jgi:hypothetical protein
MAFRTKELIVDSQHATVGGYRLLANQQIINGDLVPIVNGMPITIVGNNTAKRSSAASTAFSTVDGIVFVGAAQTLNMMVRAAGLLELATADWDLVTGGSGGLLPGVPYYLGTTPGSLTTTPPWQDG